ncbi:hypothetical protein HG536_0E04980 [Torulaspora globosa]|uniref:Cargo-transport protein YPP1 n=1 Tax=Torulaspora globosa TaxID=48254 RepID=A0A7G3ZJA1_9SACH|nr:uncharacterized protein HG536_0E04980 [Torulaspora globosa]QLL33587.1 hypothetical protein HG536_0E04980 [Torulaspora globosa]
MVVLGDAIERSLAARLLGAGEFNSGDAVLDRALRLQFRVQYHLFGAGMTAVVGQVLLDECEKVGGCLAASAREAQTSRLIDKVLHNTRGVLCFHLGEMEDAVTQLEAARAIGIGYGEFGRYLELENLYYRGLCQDSPALYGSELAEVVEAIPDESQGLALHYLYAILEKLAKEANKTEMLKQLPQTSSVGLMARHFSREIREKELLSLAQAVLQKAKFPQAKETNDVELERFHAFMSYYFRTQKSVSAEWGDFIVASMQRTFQSVKVAKSAMLYFAKTNGKATHSRRESVLNFINFARYAEKHYVISGGTYQDVMSLIDCYSFVLRMARDESWNIESVFNVEETTNKLLKLLHFFYHEYNFPLMENAESLNWLENSSKLFLPRTVSRTLSEAWEVLYQVRAESLKHMVSNDLACYLSNAMCAAPKGSNLADLQFEYSYVLASQRKIEPAIKVLKSVLLEANPELYKAWHLLALCESIHENKEVSFKIVCSVLEAMKESLAENKLRILDRWQFIQLKLTQLSLIDELFGTLDASEMLPEVFELYSVLFPADTEEFDRIGDKCKQSKEYLLQAIWIFAANLYMRLGDKVEDAKKAISEAEQVTDKFKNLNCDLARGYLKLINGEPRAALSNFETVLFYDPLNVNALIGFAQIIFPEELNESEAALREYWHLEESNKGAHSAGGTTQQVFVSDLDKSAACARLKFLLEYAITKSIEAYHSPEVWWYLSSIYEKYEDQSYKASLLNCIRYKESDPIRAFQSCNF